MIRRSIVDLSDPKNNGDNAMATQQKKAQQIRRVASKRRASASNRPLKLSPSASSAELKMLSDEGSSVNESRISNYDTEIPGCRMALKEFRKRNCAIYEPILTLRTVSSLRPLFFRCLDYIDSHMDEFKSIDDDDTENIFPSEVVATLRNASVEFLDHVQRLEETDDTLMNIIHDIEVEGSELFQHQLRWCCEHATPVKDEHSDMLLSNQRYYIPPWETAMVNRLENLEEKKQKVAELERVGNQLCESLDKVICESLSSVLLMIQKLSPARQEEVSISSSLRSHPSLLRYRGPSMNHDSHHQLDSSINSSIKPINFTLSSLSNSGTHSSLSNSGIFAHESQSNSLPVANVTPPLVSSDTPQRGSANLSTSASSNKSEEIKPDQDGQKIL